MKIYKGHVTPGQMDWFVTVFEYEPVDLQVPLHAPVSAKDLDPRNDLVNHSPDGFSWGYNGSGPAQLALAILCDCLGDDKLALTFYQEFKDIVLASLDSNKCWELDEFQVKAAVHALELKALRQFVVDVQNRICQAEDTDSILRLEPVAAELMRRYRIAGDILDDSGDVIETIE